MARQRGDAGAPSPDAPPGPRGPSSRIRPRRPAPRRPGRRPRARRAWRCSHSCRHAARANAEPDHARPGPRPPWSAPVPVNVTSFEGIDLDDDQVELLRAIREYVDRDVLPHVREYEEPDVFPEADGAAPARDGRVRHAHPAGVRRHGPRPGDLRAGHRGALARLDVDLRHRQRAVHRRRHDRVARHRGAEAAVPAADGRRGVPRRLLDDRARRPAPTAGDPHARHAARATSTSSTAPRCGSRTACARRSPSLAKTDPDASRPGA